MGHCCEGINIVFMIDVSIVMLVFVMFVLMFLVFMVLVFFVVIVIRIRVGVRVRILMDVMVIWTCNKDINFNGVRSIMIHLLGLIFNLVQKSSVAQNIMDWCMRLCQNVGTLEMFLQSLNVVGLPTVMFAHVFLKRRSIVLIDLACFGFGCDNAFHDGGVLLQDVKSHLEDIVHLELIAETLFLVVRVNVAQSLAT